MITQIFAPRAKIARVEHDVAVSAHNESEAVVHYVDGSWEFVAERAILAWEAAARP